MTYSMFLIVFIIPLVVLGLIYFKQSTYFDKKNLKQAMYLLMLMAFVYTTPWDNYLVKTGIWSYEDHNILFKIGYVPFEEYCFFLLQTVMTTSWCLFILNKNEIKKNTDQKKAKYFIVSLFAILFVSSLLMLQNTSTKYLGLILVWVLPVFILQWVIGGEHLIANLKTFMLCLWPPTIYLWLADSYALYKNIWSISETQTIGLKLYTLPFEEAVFFLATNLMLCQGLILYLLLKNDFFKKKATL